MFNSLVLESAELRLPHVRSVARPTPLPEDEAGEEGQQQWQVLPGDIEFDASPSDIKRRLRRIRDNARTTVEERGVTTLHVAIGSVQWTDQLFGESVAPIWLVPCSLKSTGVDSPLVLTTTEEDAEINPALQLWLRERHKKSLPDASEEPDAQFVEGLLRAVSDALGSEWKVTDEAWLSTFSFETLAMYRDLQAMADIAVQNKIVQVFARANAAIEGSETLPHDLDLLDPVRVAPIPALPADSSQLEALTHARSGKHLLVHGPPGTGKSQTIANLIADALGEGKTVLFVSAKMAALDVVFNRLATLGMDRFCLEAHSVKAGKMKIIADLKRALQQAEERTPANIDNDVARFKTLRDDLNDYVRELHKKRGGLRQSVYFGLAQSAKCADCAALTFALPWPDLHAVTGDQLQSVFDLLSELKAQARIFEEKLHPWRGCGLREASITNQERIFAALSALMVCTTATLELAKELDPALGNRSITQIEGCADLLTALSETEELPVGWSKARPDELARTGNSLRATGEKLIELRDAEREFSLAAPSLDPLVAKDDLSPALTGYRAWYRRMSPAYFRWKRKLKENLPHSIRTFSQIQKLARLAAIIATDRAWLSENASGKAKKSALDPQYLLTEAKKYEQAARIRGGLDLAGLTPNAAMKTVPDSVRSAAARLFATLPKQSRDVSDGINAIQWAWPRGFVENEGPSDIPARQLSARCAEVIQGKTRLSEWVILLNTIDRCTAAGLGPFLEALPAAGASACMEVFERRFWQLWTDSFVSSSPTLGVFQGTKREELIREFRSVDTKLSAASARMAIFGAAARAAEINTNSYAANRHSQLGILRRELQKKRPRPLRRLFADIPQVLQAIKPCMLMSPVSVSTYLTPGSINFDVVVFDEASQVPPAEAIPAILRGDQVVVAGDDNQLPPTAFFSSSLFSDEAEEEEEQGNQPLESLLRECAAAGPLFSNGHLRWHYRSRDERLIAFSNHYFYDGRLITFPPAEQRTDRGVQLVYVEKGVWDRGRSKTNRAEARVVARLIERQLHQFPGRSVGVVAMSISQKEAIEDALAEQLQNRPDLQELLSPEREEPFFIKSLENVQGDERDTIIISVGYGPDANGQVFLNFGPLNMEGGWRRLNVLVTRAKDLTILVTSLRSSQLKGIQPTNRGATTLKQYIEYAEQGCKIPSEGATPTDAPTNDFEDAIAEALRARGLLIDEQVGASGFRIDLAVRDPRNPNRYLLGIECDGATYHSARTARDRDLLRTQILREMGWRLYRIWSIDWFRNPDETIVAAIRAVERALDGPDSEIEAQPVRAEPTDHPQTTPQSAPRSSSRYLPGAPYVRSTKRVLSRYVLMDPASISALRTSMLAIIELESPIHQELLLQRIKDEHGVGQAGTNVRRNFLNALNSLIRAKKVVMDKHGIVWKPEQEIETFRVPTGNNDRRPIEYVPAEEIQLAVLYAVENQFGIPREVVPKEIAKLFGYERTPSAISDAIADQVDALIESGELRASGFQVTLP